MIRDAHESAVVIEALRESLGLDFGTSFHSQAARIRCGLVSGRSCVMCDLHFSSVCACVMCASAVLLRLSAWLTGIAGLQKVAALATLDGNVVAASSAMDESDGDSKAASEELEHVMAHPGLCWPVSVTDAPLVCGCTVEMVVMLSSRCNLLCVAALVRLTDFLYGCCVVCSHLM